VTASGPFDSNFEGDHADDGVDVGGGHDHRSGAALCVGFDAITLARVSNLLLSAEMSCEHVDTLEAALAHIVSGATDIVLVSDRTESADFAPLASQARRISASIKVIVVGDAPESTQLLDAVRAGAVDWLDLSFDHDGLVARLRAAFDLGCEDRAREQRIARLKSICRKLSMTRGEFSRHIDSLNEGLSDFRERVDEAAIVGEFRGLISQELDVEDLLRTAMQYMLTKTGATNAAVFLPGSKPNQFGLGAYVNYDCPRTTADPLLSRLAEEVCPRLAAGDDIMRFSDTAEFIDSLGLEASVLDECELVAWPAQHGGECMGVFFLFRNRTEPFKDELAGLIDALRPVFAAQMAKLVRVHHRSRFLWPDSRADINDVDEDDEGEGWRRAA
jgi:DNA-binding NarL/FixJ family response regulator